MRILKYSLKVGVASVVGFLCGVALFHVPVVKAQLYGSTVFVDEVVGFSEKTKGSQIVGFSCVREGDDTRCYVASK